MIPCAGESRGPCWQGFPNARGEDVRPTERSKVIAMTFAMVPGVMVGA
jgi:hypothetical protein